MCLCYTCQCTHDDMINANEWILLDNNGERLQYGN